VLHFCRFHANPNIDLSNSLPQTTARSVHALPHNYATKAPLVTMGHPKFHPKTALPFRRSPPHLIHPSSTDRTLSSQRHPNPLNRFATVHFADRQTDRPTDRQIDRRSRRTFRNISAYARLIDSDALKSNLALFFK